MKQRPEILEEVRHFCQPRPAKFSREKPKVPVSGKVIDGDDVAAIVDAALDMHFTAGRFTDDLETQLAKRMENKHALFCNSGSSANLLAVSALRSNRLGRMKLTQGDEVMVPAASFPTTAAPIVQNGLVPVFVDTDNEGNIDMVEAEAAITPKTRAIIAAHSLGQPYDAPRLAEICKKHGMFLIEDCCDALGATIKDRSVGSFGDMATLSFYPAHQITAGEGGAVLTSNPALKAAVASLRDWGRHCWCKTGCDNTCGKRFGWKLGSLPEGYDHKYIYSEIGYNLKATDMQAALCLSQLGKLDKFVETRRDNFAFYLKELAGMGGLFVLPKNNPEASPFGFLLQVKEDAPFIREELVRWLDKNGIATRALFGGNLTKQPAFENVRWRAGGSLHNSDALMERAFWLGVSPNVSREMQEYVVEKIREFVGGKGYAGT